MQSLEDLNTAKFKVETIGTAVSGNRYNVMVCGLVFGDFNTYEITGYTKAWANNVLTLTKS